MLRNNIFIICVAIASLGLFSSCDKFFEANSDDILIDDDYIGNNNELYAGFIGISAKVQKAADQIIFLSELRSDLLEPTSNAPQDLWDIYNFSEQVGNEYANPKALYDVIVNANNYVNKAHAYLEANPIAVDSAIFLGLISGAIRYKVWAYLNLGKLYDEVAFFDDNLVEYRDVSGFEKLRLTDGSLVNTLLDQMRLGMRLENGSRSENGQSPIFWNAIFYPDQNSSAIDITWSMICPEREMIMSELYLWAGRYRDASNTLLNYLFEQAQVDNDYKMLTNEDWNGEWMEFFSNTERKLGDAYDELINIIPYDNRNNQNNRLLDHFANEVPGKYYLRPSVAAITRWEAQDDEGDQYRGLGRTYDEINGDWVFSKYFGRSDFANDIYRNEPHIILYRAAEIHLWMAEALVDQGLITEAEAFLNDGAENYFANNFGNYQYPFEDEVINPTFARHLGVRGRVSVPPVFPDGMTRSEAKAAKDQIASTGDNALLASYTAGMDSLIVEEALLELAGEAKAHAFMVRMALKYNDNSIVADRVSAKYPAGQREAVREMLMNDPSSWFVKYDLGGLDSE